MGSILSFLGGTLAGIGNVLFSVLSGGFSAASSLIKQAMGGIMEYHKTGIEFARGMGMSLQQAQAYTNVLTERAQRLAITYGLSVEAVKELQANLAEASGKAVMLNDVDAEKFVQINKLVGSSVAKQFTSTIMTSLGGQLRTVEGAVSKAYATAAKSGLNAAQFSDKVAKNLSLANKLSFRDGVNGIIRMTALSEKLGFNLQSVEQAANNFMELDKAIEHSAQLQMLGGAAGAYGSNPLLMSYEANYDPEAFTERMTKTLGGYATFDAKTGMANVNGMNRDFVKNIAQAMGISMDEAMSIAKKTAEVNYKESQFGAEIRSRGYSKQQEDYIINSSYIGEDGRLKMTDMNGKEQDVDTLVQNGQLDQMMSMENKSDEQIMRDQAMQLTSINEKLEGLETSSIAALAKSMNAELPKIMDLIETFAPTIIEQAEILGQKAAKAVDDVITFIKDNTGFITDLIKGISNFLGFILDNFKWFLLIYAGTKILGMLGNIIGLFRGGFGLIRGLFKGGARVGRAAVRGGRSLFRGAKNLGGKLLRGGRSVGRAGVKATRAIGRTGLRAGRAAVTGGRSLLTKARGGVTNSGVVSYGRYVKGNYRALRASGNGRLASLRRATKAPKVIKGANGTQKIMNSATGKIMGNVGGKGAKSLQATKMLKFTKAAKGAGALGIGMSVLGAGLGMNDFKDTKKDLDAQLAGGQITQQEYNDTMKEATNNKNEAIGESVGAIAGGALGSLLGPVGTAAGAWLGGEVGGFIGKHWQETTDFIKDTWNGPVRDFAESVFGQAGAGIVDGVGDVVGGVANGVGDVLGGAASAVGDIAKGVWDGIGEAGTGVVDGFGQMLEGDIGGGLLTMGEGLFNGIGTVAEGVWDGIKDLGEGVWDGISSVATGVWDGIGDVASGVWGTVQEGWGNFTDGVSAAWGAVTDGVGAAWDWVSNGVSDAWNGVTSFVSDAWNGSIDTITNVATNMWDGVSDIATSVFSGIGDFFGGIFGTIGDAIGDAWDWTTGAISDAADWVGNAASDAWDFVSSGFGLFSKGGVVGGNQTEGDNVLVRVNSGEMVLNPDQQSKLFGLIDGLPSSLINGLFGNDIISTFSGAVSGVWDGITSLFGGGSSDVAKSIQNSADLVSSVASSILTNTNDVIAKPVGEREYIYEPRGTEVSNVNGNQITVNDINVKINGTIKLDAGNSSRELELSKLLNDSQFISSLKEIIKTSMNNDVNGGRFMNDTAQMRGLPSQTALWGRR